MADNQLLARLVANPNGINASILNNVLLQYHDTSEVIYSVCPTHTHTLHVHFFEIKNKRQGYQLICWKPDSYIGLCIEWRKGQCIDSIEVAMVTNKDKSHNILLQPKEKEA